METATMQHSPAPWFFIKGKKDKSHLICGHYRIATLKTDFDGMKADMDLIAAAPELLEALKAITYERDGRWFIGLHGDSDVTEQVGRAIAKAEGIQ